jgi:Ca2+-transporting ATPase
LFIVLISFIQEYKATSEIESIQKLTPKLTKVMRDGKKEEILSENIVPGDIIFLERGDLVPADARVLESNNLQVDESSLTGESVPVSKVSKLCDKKSSLADRNNMVYAGGKITTGNGVCVVVNTGRDTELGKIASMVKEATEITSPLQKKLDSIGKKFSYFVLLLCGIIFISGLLQGQGFANILLLSIAVAVGGIPESLPLVISLALSVGMRRMAKNNAIIKKLSSVETLGTCTVICTDKTGTLTQNKMVVENIWTPNIEVSVSGNGFDPKGFFLKESVKMDPKKHKDISKLLEIGILCNNASFNSVEKEWHIEGESTEGALVVLAKKAGFEKDIMHQKFPRMHENPFDPDRKLMSCVHLINNKPIAYMKGAPEHVLSNCKYYLDNGKIKKLTKSNTNDIIQKNEDYANKGYRVLALSFKEHTSKKSDLSSVEKDQIFVGLVSIRDPPEPSALDAIKQCSDAGIRVVMITGDNPLTAKAIAKELNITKDEQKVLTGSELDDLSDTQLLEQIGHISVYARVTPKHKLRIVSLLQQKGDIVAMTGDGVNDAPALKKADIGIAMGKCGTEVAKEASEMILLDDNFSTIVGAVKEGRNIYNNLRKFIYYLLPINITQVFLILIATVTGIFAPLTAIMILFINLITGDFPALGIVFEKSDDSIMNQPPRNPKEGLLNTYLLMKIGQVVPVILLGTIGLFQWEISSNNASQNLAQTIAFASIIMFSLFHIFNAKSFTKSVFSLKTLKNGYLFAGVFVTLTLTFFVIYFEPASTIFKTVPLSLANWLQILVASSIVLIWTEIQKGIIQAEIDEFKDSKAIS